METFKALECIRAEILALLSINDCFHASWLTCDKWIAASVLQKAIRRGERVRALQAAATLHRLDPAMLRRRLLVIAVEDIGLADLLTATRATAALDNAAWGRAQGAERITALLVKALAEAAKCRDADLLLAVVSYHPEYSEAAQSLADLETGELLRLVEDRGQDFVTRAIAAMYAAGTRHLPGTHIRGRAGCDAIWHVLHDMGAPSSLVAASVSNARRTGYPLALWTILCHLEAKSPTTEHHCLADPGEGDGIPLVALDMFTRVGKPAIREWRAQCSEVRRYPLRAVQAGVFFAEGGLVDRQLKWEQSERLYRLATEAEMAGAGLPSDAFSSLRAVVESELPTLQTIRRRLISQGPVAQQSDLFGGRLT